MGEGGGGRGGGGTELSRETLLYVPRTSVFRAGHLPLLEKELALVDQVGIAPDQHEGRRWEYAMALRAARAWLACQPAKDPNWYHGLPQALDVGGAGSGLELMLARLGVECTIIDPAVPGGRTVEELVASPEPPARADMVFSISVLEHVEDLATHVAALAKLVAPGGLLFITADYCLDLGEEPEDLYHFHWMRRRIFNLSRWAKLTAELEGAGMRLFGGVDMEARGELATGHWGYTFASLAMRREG